MRSATRAVVFALSGLLGLECGAAPPTTDPPPTRIPEIECLARGGKYDRNRRHPCSLPEGAGRSLQFQHRHTTVPFSCPLKRTYTSLEAVEVTVSLCEVAPAKLGLVKLAFRNVSSRRIELRLHEQDYELLAASVRVDGKSLPDPGAGRLRQEMREPQWSSSVLLPDQSVERRLFLTAEFFDAGAVPGQTSRVVIDPWIQFRYTDDPRLAQEAFSENRRAMNRSKFRDRAVFQDVMLWSERLDSKGDRPSPSGQ